jgi:hypothetical protein
MLGNWKDKEDKEDKETRRTRGWICINNFVKWYEEE